MTALASVPAPAGNAPRYAWVQYDGGGYASARAIVNAGSGCPQVQVNGVGMPMTPRTSPPAFNAIEVCEYSFKAGTGAPALAIGTLALPTATAADTTVLVVGDTGCREKGNDQQDCNTVSTNKATWGFPLVSATAATHKVDVNLHVGDYLYRESQCTSGPCGDNWAAWEADFFAPAEGGGKGILRTAPWILVRGNHEDCSRAWDGYNLFFAPSPLAACPKAIPPYTVSLADIDVQVMDTSSESVTQAATDYATVKANLSNRDTWLTTHVPVCSSAACNDTNGHNFTKTLGGEATLRWVHVGHVHLFDHMAATANLHPAQTVSGGGGTERNTSSACQTTADCVTAQYTFTVVNAVTGGWTGTVYDPSGTTMLTLGVPPTGAPAPGGGG